MAQNCNCWNVESQLYFTDFCKSQRRSANNIPPQGCLQMEEMNTIPASRIPTGVKDPVIESAKGGRGGFDFGGLFGGLAEGLSGAFGSSPQQQGGSQFQPTQAPIITTQTQPKKAWIPFAVIGGLAVVGVVVYFGFKNSK